MITHAHNGHSHGLGPEIPQPALDAQRAYAAHVLLLRGYVQDSGSGPPEPPRHPFELVDRYVSPGQDIRVRTEFRSPPLAAFVDNFAVPMRVESDPVAGTVRVTLTAPGGTRGGPVRLLWPRTLLYSTEPVWIASERLEMRDHEAPVGGDLIIGLFPERPSEVHIGWKEVPANHIHWENRLLKVRVPDDASPGPVLVVTPTRVYQSEHPFRPVTA